MLQDRSVVAQQYSEACVHGADLRLLFLSRPGASEDAVVCKSPQSGGGGGRKLTSEIKDTCSWRQLWCGGPRLPRLWSEVFLVVQLVTATRMKGMGRKAARPRGPARRHNVSGGGGRRPVRPPQNKGRLAVLERGNFSCVTASNSSCVVFWRSDRPGRLWHGRRCFLLRSAYCLCRWISAKGCSALSETQFYGCVGRDYVSSFLILWLRTGCAVDVSSS